MTSDQTSKKLKTKLKNCSTSISARSKYDPKLCTDLTKLMAAGNSDTQVIAQWGISRDTFYRWLREHEELKEAHEVGKVMFDAIHEKLGVEGMLKTADIDYQFWRDLGKFRNKWTDKSETSTNNTQININFLQQQTNQELIEYIQENLDVIEENKD